MALEGKVARVDACGGVYSAYAASSLTLPLRRRQSASDQVEVCQGEHGEQSRRVFRQAPVAHLGKAPQPLHHVEGVLASSSSGRTQAVEPSLGARQSVAMVGPAVDAVTDTAGARRLPVRLAPVGLITVDLALATMQQLVHLADVRSVRSRGDQGVHDPAWIGSNVRLHPEVPLSLVFLPLL